MNIRSLAKFLAPLLLLFQCSGNALAQSDSSGQPTTSSLPTIRFLRPIADERFFDFPIFVQVEVTGFKLIPPTADHSAPVPENCGHIQYTMDDYPVVTSEEDQIMIGKKLGNDYLPVGRHLLRAQLVNVNGNSLNPPVQAAIEIYSGHPTMMQGIRNPASHATLTADDLNRMHQHLMELEKEMKNAASGNSGYSPTPQADMGQSSE